MRLVRGGKGGIGADGGLPYGTWSRTFKTEEKGRLVRIRSAGGRLVRLSAARWYCSVSVGFGGPGWGVEGGRGAVEIDKTSANKRLPMHKR